MGREGVGRPSGFAGCVQAALALGSNDLTRCAVWSLVLSLLWEMVVPHESREFSAGTRVIIQAGGRGTRLQPFTTVLPKPLMPVGGLPVIEILLKWLRRSGVQEIYITTGHLGRLLRSLCGDGSQWDMQIQYTEEPEPLGTVGALDLLRENVYLSGDRKTRSQ